MRRDGKRLWVDDRPYFLDQLQRVIVVGCGKAAAPMAGAVAELLGERISAGVVITKEGYGSAGDELDRMGTIAIREAGHPIPDERGQRATEEILRNLRGLSEEDLVICLISGGGSALMTCPARGVSLEDVQKLTSVLLACGATITEINTLRKHLDEVKGGGLARAAFPAHLVTLTLSDVVGDALDVIASGPTVPDTTTYSDALAVLDKYDVADQVPASLLEHLHRGARGEVPDTPKVGDPAFDRLQNVMVGNNRLAVEAALRQAAREGFETLCLTAHLQGEARRAGQVLAGLAHQLARCRQHGGLPICAAAGGETTVTLTGDGIGGRNQEVALGAVPLLAGLEGVFLVALATDGGDGPTDAAGAVATGDTLGRARRLGLNPEDYLMRDDAYHFFAALGDLLKPGPTRTNVNDLAFVFIL
jgi:hydroxypyruvate reductase